MCIVTGKHETISPLQNLNEMLVCYNTPCTLNLILIKGFFMNFKSNEEQKQFIEVATMLKYYKAKGVPIPADVREMIERDCDNNEVCRVLYDIIHE